LLAGRHPFREARASTGGWQKALAEGELFVGDLPPDVAAFFTLAPAREYDLRFRTADEFLIAFRRRPISGAGFEPELEAAIRTGVGVVFINSVDEVDTLARVRTVAAAFNLEFRTWSLTSGITDRPFSTPGEQSLSPHGALQWLRKQEKPTMLAALDFDAFLDDWQVAFQAAEDLFREFQDARTDGTRRDYHSYVSTYSERRDESGSSVALPKAEIRRLLVDFLSNRGESGEVWQLGKAGGERARNALVIVAPGFVVPEDLNKHIRVLEAPLAHRDDVYALLHEAGIAKESGAQLKFYDIAGVLLPALARGLVGSSHGAGRPVAGRRQAQARHSCWSCRSAP